MPPFLTPLIEITSAIVGALLLFFGLKTLSTKTFALDKDSNFDKWLLSEYSRYWIARYYAGGQAVTAGLILLALSIFIAYTNRLPF